VPGKPASIRISDVAAAAGVSKALVSYALNGRSGVGEATRAHIIEVARTMGWTPSLRGRSLSVSRAYAIGLVFQTNPEFLASDLYFTSLMAGIQSVLASSYSLVTEVVATIQAEHSAYQRLARDGRVDGFVVVGPTRMDKRYELLTDIGMPFVSLGLPPAKTTMPVMVYDSAEAIADVVAHLASFGHRHIAQVTGPRDSGPSINRRKLYQAELRKHGIADTWWVASDYTAAGGRRETERLLDAPRPPTAIIYSNDMMAIAGMSVVFARGLRVPEDVSIVGWDDFAVSQYLHPSLSTVGQHPYEDGQQAATVLLEAIEGKAFDEPIRTRNPRFLRRDSTGPAPRATKTTRTR
jgi:LacI family transcriptional regulator, repressor for deo operon, udp, cdd, tsx, nupC, and nupG